jgi:tartrate dehydratase alpha subunit/fumarate hydratase class I-like protein
MQYAENKLRSICRDSQGKPIPNWYNIEDMQGFAIRLTEAELNLTLSVVVYPVDEAGPGNFLVRLQATFTGKPVIQHGFEFMPAPLGIGVQLDQAMYAETEQELMDGILEWIHDETENILCQILE